MIRSLLALSLIALAASAHADQAFADVTVGSLTLDHGYARATLPGATVAAGFVTIHNAGPDDRLTGGSAPFAATVEVHEMTLQGDVMKMRPLPDGLTIPADATVEMKPGGYHLMFIGLKAPLREGAAVSVTLTFDHAGQVDITLPVVAAIRKN